MKKCVELNLNRVSVFFPYEDKIILIYDMLDRFLSNGCPVLIARPRRFI